MSERKIVKPVAMAVGMALAGAFAIGNVASAETVDNPFEISTLTAGYMLGEGEGSCGGDKKDKDGEGSCGEGSCGGDDHDKEGESEDKDGEGSCGGDKEDKEGEGSCGGDKKDKDGEGSCGGLV